MFPNRGWWRPSRKPGSTLPTIRPTATPRFTRPRLRAILPVLAAEGGDTRNLARLASRLGRANAAVEIMVDGAERYLALRDRESSSRRLPPTLSTAARLLPCRRKFGCGCCCVRSIDTGTRGRPNWARSRRCSRRWTAQRRKAARRRKRPGLNQARLKQTLAGALVSLIDDRIRIEPSPPRRRRTVTEGMTARGHGPIALTTPANTYSRAII